MSIEFLEGLGNTLGHRLLTLTDPDTWVIVLLVWLVRTVWVTDLSREVILLVEDVVADTGEVAIDGKQSSKIMTPPKSEIHDHFTQSTENSGSNRTKAC
jgi:hypothetical protein